MAGFMSGLLGSIGIFSKHIFHNLNRTPNSEVKTSGAPGMSEY